MARRRMLDPDFWKDHSIAALTREERLLLIGCINFSDDEGRLEGHPGFLKGTIFMYDDDLNNSQVSDLKESLLDKTKNWPQNHQFKILRYCNSNEEYLYFPNWNEQQKPSHPTKSKLPSPTEDAQNTSSGNSPETLVKNSGDSPEKSESSSRETHEALRPRSGQSSLGQGSIGKCSEVHEDFTNYDNERDLTDILMKTMTEKISAGAEQASADVSNSTVRANWGIQVLKKCWKDKLGTDMSAIIFDQAHNALRQYDMAIVAKAFAKGCLYKGGKHKSWKYFQAIIDEELDKKDNGVRS